ncbi:MAG: Asp23/Gls24 family envelope stress response protein [Eubacteriales bacterium]|nr:Asp23/Gls24 family envelope stress response protein [Eubacteriales bacterium]
MKELKSNILKKTKEILQSIEGVEETVSKGISIEDINEKEVRLEIFIKTKIGYPIPKIAQMAQRKIKEEIEECYNIKVASVDVNVLELQF